jgi:hypothetical protein
LRPDEKAKVIMDKRHEEPISVTSGGLPSFVVELNSSSQILGGNDTLGPFGGTQSRNMKKLRPFLIS